MAILREQPYTEVHVASVRVRMSDAARQPRNLAEYIRWLRTEFAKEVPGRIHERGVEADSALGSPRLAGAFRAYLCGSAFATDHDDRLDMDMRDATRVRPIHHALAVMEHKWPLSARFLFALAWTGVEWQDIALAWRMMPEVGHRFAYDALAHLWSIWARDLAA